MDMRWIGEAAPADAMRVSVRAMVRSLWPQCTPGPPTAELQRVPVLQWQAHGADRSPPRRSCHPTGVRAPVGDLRAEAVAGLSHCPSGRIARVRYVLPRHKAAN
jgi:hypothetical protein